VRRPLSELDAETRPLRRAEYDRLVDLGMLEGERLELLYGRLVHKSPQGDDHSGAVDELNMILTPQLVGRARVRVQLPFIAPDESEPEPDIAVTPLRPPFAGKPRIAHLVIEVSATSQRKDRGLKGGLYASAGVPEFWLVDVEAGCVERYRRPVDGRYAESSLHGRDETLTLLAFPDVAVALGQILPPG
jgi:Uma2 family endonuclease